MTTHRSPSRREGFRLSTPHFSTKQLILDSAEALFERHCFVGASMRQVTAAAKVNLAAVNYHFGSKENLINEVFRRRLDVLNSERLRALAGVESNPGHCLEDVLAAFVEPALARGTDGTMVAVVSFACSRELMQEHKRRAAAQVSARQLQPHAKALCSCVCVAFAAFGQARTILAPRYNQWRADLCHGGISA